MLKLLGTPSRDIDMLKLSVITCWLARFFLVPGHRCYSGPAALFMLTLSRILLTSAVDTDSGRSSGGGVDFTADSLLRISKRVYNEFSSSGNMASHIMGVLLLLKPVIFWIACHISLVSVLRSLSSFC